MESIDIMPMRVRVAAKLRKAILAGEFEEGQSLSLTEISQQLGISRTPVREAFQTLASEGFIELRMNKHALVRGINLKFIQDHYKMRILLEGEAVFCAANTNMDTAELSGLTRTIRNRLPRITAEDFDEYNQCFHVLIWEAADNQRLQSYLMGLWNGASVGKSIRSIEHFSQSITEHEKIITAVSMCQAEEAKQYMHTHIIRGMQNILESYQQIPAGAQKAGLYIST